MKSILPEIKELLGKPYADFEFLLQCLQEVLLENNEEVFAAQIPWISGREPVFNERDREKLLHLYSICFQLLNLSEVNGAVQNRRKKVERKGLEGVNGLWGDVLHDLKKRGASEQVILEEFKKIDAEPVLTAHPTEAKRPVVLRLYRELYLQLVKRENSMYTDYEQEEIRYDIKQILHKLWFIGEIFVEKPAVESELENVLHYFYQVFPEVLHYHDFKLEQAWKDAGFDPSVVDDTEVYPLVTFGNWVGGDRDGHPLVTAEVSEYTLRAFRLHAFALVNSMLDELSDKLSIYADRAALDPDFLARLRKLEAELGAGDSDHFEPYKHYLELLKLKLPLADRTEGVNGLMETEHSYKNSDELEQDLQLLKSAIFAMGWITVICRRRRRSLRRLSTI